MIHPEFPDPFDDNGELHDLSEPFPNSWDLEYLKWRADLEAFAVSLRDWWRNQQDDADQELVFKWEGTAHAVSKPFQAWMKKSDFAKNDRTMQLVVDTVATRAMLGQLQKARKG